MNRLELLKIIEDDNLGLLSVSSQSRPRSSEERGLESFLAINDFVREKGRAPQNQEDGITEFSLYCRLQHIRDNMDKFVYLLGHDEFDLLSSAKTINSVEDFFSDDNLGLLTQNQDSIFDIRHIPKDSTWALPSYIAQRRPCLNFGDYELVFKLCHRDLISGKRRIKPFSKEQQISVGDLFVLKGVLTYIVNVGEKEVKNGKRNARLHCVFENGTESDILLRSLARELYRDGRRITVDAVMHDIDNITADDIQSGYIYILQSHSMNSEIRAIRDLYKIGFSRFRVEERIKNAKREPTFLMAPVSLIASYQCYNLNPQKLESRLHRFFGKACLDIEVLDGNGVRHAPREWFIAPLKIIEQTVDLLRTDEIVNYSYDLRRQKIILN